MASKGDSVGGVLVHRDFAPTAQHNSPLRGGQLSPINRDSFKMSTMFAQLDTKSRSTLTKKNQLALNLAAMNSKGAIVIHPSYLAKKANGLQ